MKLTFLLLAVGLVVGLWLGFDPQAHTKTVQAWHTVQSFFANVGTKTVTTGRHTALPPSAKLVSSPKSNSGWSQVSTDFSDLWRIIQKIWHDIGVSLHLIKS